MLLLMTSKNPGVDSCASQLGLLGVESERCEQELTRLATVCQ
jgi:hypothetical protein